MNSEIIIYQHTEGNIRIDVRLEDEKFGNRVKSAQGTQFRIGLPNG